MTGPDDIAASMSNQLNTAVTKYTDTQPKATSVFGRVIPNLVAETSAKTDRNRKKRESAKRAKARKNK